MIIRKMKCRWLLTDNDLYFAIFWIIAPVIRHRMTQMIEYFCFTITKKLSTREINLNFSCHRSDIRIID